MNDENKLNDRPKKAYALLIGVKDVDDIHYGDDKDFCGAKANVKELYDMVTSAHVLGQKVFLEENIYDKSSYAQTTWDSISLAIKSIRDQVNSSNSETYFFIYFSGHGAYLNVKRPEKRQFLCFSDRMVMHQELERELSGFNERTKIFVLIDACSSGFAKNLNKKRSLIRSIDNTTESVFKEFYDRTYKRVVLENYDFEFNGKADVCITSATDKHGSAIKGMDCKKSKFTRQFSKQWWDNGNSSMNYDDFSTYVHYKNDSSFFKQSYPLIFK